MSYCEEADILCPILEENEELKDVKLIQEVTIRKILREYARCYKCASAKQCDPLASIGNKECVQHHLDYFAKLEEAPLSEIHDEDFSK